MNNTIKRTFSGIGVIGLIVVGLLVHPLLYVVIFSFMIGIMLWEFYRMTMGELYPKSRLLGAVCGIVIFLVFFLISGYGVPFRYASVIFLPIFLLMVTSLYVDDRKDFHLFSHIYAGLLYIALPFSLMNLAAFRDGSFSGSLLLAFFILVWASDVGAYVFGMWLGQRYGKKLFPEISPKKSWIGAVGGMISSLLAAFVMNRTGLLDFPLLHTLVLALLMDVAGVYGDLFESQWKRCFDIKDSGHIIPGHGGFMDRFDSMLLAFPVGIIYLIVCHLS